MGAFLFDININGIGKCSLRVDKSHNREAGRFGLGLFEVKTIIEKQDGTVGVLNTQKDVLF